jgi:hypothetical protein
MFVSLLRESGVSVVDPRSAFERDGNPLSFHFAEDGHWNARGHRLAGAVLGDYLAASDGRAVVSQ